MRRVLFGLLLLIPVAAFAAMPAFVADHKAYAEDQSVATLLKSIPDSKHFDEDAARRFMPVLLVDDLTPEELDLYYEVINARTPVEIRSPYGPTFQLPPPDGAARLYMSLLKTALESPNFQMTLDERWLAGAPKMKELVDMSTFGPRLNNAILAFVHQKFATVVVKINETGPEPLKAMIAQARMQLTQSDIQTEKRGRMLLYTALKDIDDETQGTLPDELYVDLKP